MGERARSVAIVSGLLLLHVGLLVTSQQRNYVTIDEYAHLPAGISHWQTGTFCLYRVNPPLPRMLAALPCLWSKPKVDYRLFTDATGSRAEFGVAASFLEANRDEYFKQFRWPRILGIGWSVLGALVAYRWATALFGRSGGYLALAFWCLEPNIMAHAQLVTPDVPATAAGLLAGFCFWRYLREKTWSTAWFVGISLGLALLTKFTLLVLIPAFAALWLVWRFLRAAAPSQRRRTALGQMFLVAAVALWVVNLGYGFHKTCWRLGDYPFVSRLLAPDRETAGRETWGGLYGNRFRGGWLGQLVVPLPADCLLGIDEQRRDFERLAKDSPNYLRGELSVEGWWYYYLYAMAVKVPVGVLLAWLLAIAAVAFVRDRGGLLDELCVLLPAASVLVLVSSQTGYNHHLRYVLPALGFLMVAAGRLGPIADRGPRWIRWTVCGLVLWTAASSAAVHPHYLSYFNELAGGPENGYSHLGDSNTDWGQDLLCLKEWLEAHPQARPIHLACWTLLDPRVLGLQFRLPPSGLPDDGNETPVHKHVEEAYGSRPGWHIVSVNFVTGQSLPIADGTGGRRHLRPNELSYFQRFRPVDRIGYSMLVYRLQPGEAERARQVWRRAGQLPVTTR